METIDIISRVVGSLPAATLAALIAAFVAWRTIKNATQRDIDNHQREKLEVIYRETRKARKAHWLMVPHLTNKFQKSTGTKFRPPTEEQLNVARDALEKVDFEEAKIIAELWLPELEEVLIELEKQTISVLGVLRGDTAHPSSIMGKLTNLVSGGNAITAADAAENACKEVAHLISKRSERQRRLMKNRTEHVRTHY